MSSANSKNTNASRKPFCKVCFDAGKMESEYTNHNVKKYNVMTGKMDTICPTLNATECRYCYKLGHTAKFCPILEDRKKNAAAREAHRQRENMNAHRPAEKVNESKKPTNVFAALYDSDDEKEEVATPMIAQVAVAPNVDEFPSLSKIGRLPSITEVRSYSCVAAIPVDLTEITRIRNERQEKLASKPEPKSVKWVDTHDDSEDEYVYDEEYEEVEVVASSYPPKRAMYYDEDW
jgi:hypothetical protein